MVELVYKRTLQTEERFASQANRRNQEYGQNCEKDAAPAKGEVRPTRTLER